MRKLLLVIVVAIIAIALFINVDWRGIDFSFSIPSFANNSAQKDDETAADDGLYIDTVMYAAGHSFGSFSDVNQWYGWYFDTIPVGRDILLIYDSVGPTTLKLSLVTRQITIDLKDPDAAEKLKKFLGPIDGFKRFQKMYEESLDSVVDEKYRMVICKGYFSFSADYADACRESADKINKFVCRLADANENDNPGIPAESALYAGYDQTQYYRPVYTGNVSDMLALSDFTANKTFENWKRGGYVDSIPNSADIAINAHVYNSRFVTFSKYEHERIGFGHGMYTQTFRLCNESYGYSPQ